MKTAKGVDALQLAPFDAADYLDSEEMIAAYLDDVAATGNAHLFLKALGDVARARGMTKLAVDSGLGRESLYKALRPGAKPRYDTVQAVMAALGMRLKVTVLVGPEETRTKAKAPKPRRVTESSKARHASA
jgi:probable addiction module antidote protein